MNKIAICIYADTTGWFTEEELMRDNLVDVEFPEDVVRKWYEVNNLVKDTAEELRKPAEECTFEDWLYEVSWAGDTDGLFQFAIENGFVPERR